MKTNIYENEYDLISPDEDTIEEVSDTYYQEKRKSLQSLSFKRITWTISDIYEKYTSGKLNLQPHYQRKLVWNRKKRTQFIESLLIDIMTPPIYLAQLNDEGYLGKPMYEVVDGQQRLSAILSFFGAMPEVKKPAKTSPLILEKSGLMYYKDLLSEKGYEDIKKTNSDLLKKLSSYTIDLYLITLETDPTVKYDIFARLNVESMKLSEAELRRSIYYSPLTIKICKEFDVYCEKNKTLCNQAFTPNDRKRYNDYNRIFKSFAFYVQYDSSKVSFLNYNSRPRDMINQVLHDYQRNGKEDYFSEIENLIDLTVKSKLSIKNYNKIATVKIPSMEYTIDTLVPFMEHIDNDQLDKLISLLATDQDFINTLLKSATSTSNVESRLNVIKRHVYQIHNG